MMLPNVFSILAAAPEVVALAGDRIYRHGSAPQEVAAPYVTWFVASSVPENTLDERPKIDNYSVQIDCWSDNEGTGDEGVEELAQAVRDAIEEHYHMNGMVVNGQDPETQRFRIGMNFTFWTHRDVVS